MVSLVNRSYSLCVYIFRSPNCNKIRVLLVIYDAYVFTLYRTQPGLGQRPNGCDHGKLVCVRERAYCVTGWVATD